MIQKLEQSFILSTDHTTYCFRIMPSGHLEHMYYGEKINVDIESLSAMVEKKACPPGGGTVYSKKYPNLCLEDYCLEMSSYGKGDVREPFAEIRYSDGNTSSDFLYKKDEICTEFKPSDYQTEGMTLPYANLNDECLIITLLHKEYKIEMQLIYRVFPECDVITRSTVLKNYSSEEITIERLYSLQLDLPEAEWYITTFNGAWAREMTRHDHRVNSGMHVNESVSGVSSNRANPFVMLHREKTTEEYGDCIGCNLIYSGNHVESLSVNAYGKSRFLTGMNHKFFSWKLKPGAQFASPEAVLSYSKKGYDTLSQNMHFFVREHIVRGEWKKKDRPVLLNSWEASYFNFNERRLMRLARASRKCGIELFVLDDGWFGKRNNDTSSLGDWYVNKKKLPGGLKRLSEKVNKLGMQFGIWVEPEMVNEDSECYREHPDWVIQAPRGEQSLGRNQLLRNLTDSKVQDDIIKQMEAVFHSGHISYVKWDMNRNFSDYFAKSLSCEKQGEVSHRYVLGLYRIMDVLTREFPQILFEGCASGGNRFDLGVLCYFPQIWASDNTDAVSRASIQEGYSYGYPMSALSAHVSSCPNHQTLRITPLDTRFNIACFGNLGYECNLAELNNRERKEITEQISLYKRQRETLQYGEFHRMPSENGTKWITISKDKEHAVGMMMQQEVIPNSCYATFHAKCFAPEKEYHFYNVPKKHDIMQFGDLINAVSKVHIKTGSKLHHLLSRFVKMDGEKEDMCIRGDILNECGVKLHQGFAGTGYNQEVRLFQDYHSRLYYFDAR